MPHITNNTAEAGTVALSPMSTARCMYSPPPNKSSPRTDIPCADKKNCDRRPQRYVWGPFFLLPVLSCWFETIVDNGALHTLSFGSLLVQDSMYVLDPTEFVDIIVCHQLSLFFAYPIL